MTQRLPVLQSARAPHAGPPRRPARSLPSATVARASASTRTSSVRRDRRASPPPVNVRSVQVAGFAVYHSSQLMRHTCTRETSAASTRALGVAPVHVCAWVVRARVAPPAGAAPAVCNVNADCDAVLGQAANECKVNKCQVDPNECVRMRRPQAPAGATPQLLHHVERCLAIGSQCYRPPRPLRHCRGCINCVSSWWSTAR